jgi:hypothetical protein
MEINLQNLSDCREFEIKDSPVATLDFRDRNTIKRQAFCGKTTGKLVLRKRRLEFQPCAPYSRPDNVFGMIRPAIRYLHAATLSTHSKSRVLKKNIVLDQDIVGY